MRIGADFLTVTPISAIEPLAILDMTEKSWSLKHSSFLAELSVRDLSFLESRSLLRKFQARELVYFPGEAGRYVLVVARGSVRLKDLTPDGKEILLDFIDAGEVFGELAVFDGDSRSEFAEAVVPSEIVAIPREALLELMETRPSLALRLTKLIGFRRRRIENRLRNILFRSNRQRLAAMLLELLHSHGRRHADHWEITLKLSHQDLAGLIGSTRESVTLLLGKFQLEKKIRFRRRSILVLDPEALAEETNRTASPTEETSSPVRKASPKV